MSEATKILKDIIEKSQQNFLTIMTEEQARICLEELSKLRNENNINRAIINDTRKLAQEGLKVLAPLYKEKSTT